MKTIYFGRIHRTVRFFCHLNAYKYDAIATNENINLCCSKCRYTIIFLSEIYGFILKTMEKSVPVIIAVFFGWTITSFICHFYAKLFLITSSRIPTLVKGNILYLTLMQTAILFLSIYKENDSNGARKKYLILILHVCATIATNWSIAVSHAASTFAIKLMEPLTSAFVQWLVLGVRLSCIQCLSIPLVIIGAVVFAYDSNRTTFTLSLGIALAFVSNIFLAFRNVYIKEMHLSKTNLFLNNKRWISDVLTITTVGIVCLFLLTNYDISLKRLLFLYLLVIISAALHAAYTYISTVLVLDCFSVVSHAFGNIMKRLLVIALLYIVGSRSASYSNFFGIIICTVGLLIYAWSKVGASNDIYRSKIIYFRCSEMVKTKSITIVASTIVILLLLLTHLLSCRSPFTNSFLSSGMTDKGFERLSYISENEQEPNLYQLSLSQRLNFSLEKFYATDLTKYPEQANKLSPFLTKRADIISESQRIHMNVFGILLKGYKFAMLFDYSPSENKGDSAIVVGETTLLRKFNIDVIFACSNKKCMQRINAANQLSKNYTRDELVILLHGGGNVIGFHAEDKRRFKEIRMFTNFTIIMFPQSIFYRGDKQHIELCKDVYSSHPNLTFIWRDYVSYSLGIKLFPKVRSLLAPDIAFQIGAVKRFMDPTHDILWIKRTDAETPVYDVPLSAGNYSMHVADWRQWFTPKGTSPMEDTYLMTTNGLMFLSRGKVVVTDRLHGFILSILLNIPHVYIDNKYHKLSNYHNSWTHGLENLVEATSSNDALEQAKNLLKKLDNELPKISGYYKNS